MTPSAFLKGWGGFPRLATTGATKAASKLFLKLNILTGKNHYNFCIFIMLLYHFASIYIGLGIVA
jgi:hypothetical protein